MDLELSESQLAWQKKAKEFAADKIAPHIEKLETDYNFRQELFQQMVEEDFFTFAIPPNEEGDLIAYLLALKEISKVDAGIAVAMSVTSMVAEAIWHYGNSNQQERYLAKFSSGECIPASFALTEKNAGSDIKAIQTSYSIDPNNPDIYILNGEKQFITNGDSAKVILVVAKLDPSPKNNPDVFSAFLVDYQTQGLTIPKKERKLGLLTANLVSLKFDHCKLSKNQLLGKEGMGFKIALSSLDSGRLSVAAQSLGIAEAAFEAAVEYAKSRHQFGAPISQQQAVAFKLADMRVKLDAGELLIFKAVWLRSKGLPSTAEASTAKLFCSEAANWIVNEALQIHGGYGYIKDYLVEKYFRDARVTTLYEGTSEIQRLIIARHLLA
ncbi:MAG: acyl-CoA dehydrogenase family protein [Parachlamydiaceae bacterium]|nr:acyl-CoA dehydrogenase family protein [Parachlamydiaceae bacterium]